MLLFECTVGATGGSYVRVYVWVPSEKMVRALAVSSFAMAGIPSGDKLETRLLFDSSASAFVTAPDAEGWGAFTDLARFFTAT